MVPELACSSISSISALALASFSSPGPFSAFDSTFRADFWLSRVREDYLTGGRRSRLILTKLDCNRSRMEHDETGCQAPEGPILCINNCGLFGSAATMNMCSKCHKDMILKQDQAKLAASSIDNLVNGSGSAAGSGKEPLVCGNADVVVGFVDSNTISTQPADALGSNEAVEAKAKEGPNRCNTCRKWVGLTGFNCRCGNLFCAAHRYSDKHDCPFDYRTAARDAIAKANPVVKAEKLDKI